MVDDDDEVCLYYKLTYGPNGSGELISVDALNHPW